MKPQQKLLLSLLLVLFPPASAYRLWNQLEAAAAAKVLSKPYMAFLNGSNGHFCGGFLVAPSWVMTAAQCESYRPLTVILGVQDTRKEEKSWQQFEVEKYRKHPDFRMARNENDILLLKLQGNATSNSYVRRISYPKHEYNGEMECTVVGWGLEVPTTTLHETKVTLHNRRECLYVYPGFPINSICTSTNPPRALGKGDIGGPLVCKNKAYGIFSYNYNKKYSFYTSIPSYISWIDSVIKP